MSGAWQVTPWQRGDEASLRAWYDVHSSSFLHDHEGLPDDPWEEFRQVAAEDRDDELQERLLVRAADGEVAGGAAVALPLKDNTDVVEVDLVVAPSQRRRGAGTALLAAVRGLAREHGRTRLLAEVGAPLGVTPPGQGFAAAGGGTGALAEVRRALDLAAVHDTALAAHAEQAAAHAEGYDLVQWTGTPEPGLLDDLAHLRVRMSTDAPMGDLDWKPEQWDAQRVRSTYDVAAACGRIVVSTAVRHRATGRLAGWTDLAVSRYEPEHAYQWDLLVLQEHRGRRLGMLLKAENLRHFRRSSPGSRWVHTWNAASNRHMIAINEAVGFRPVEEWTEWLLPV